MNQELKNPKYCNPEFLEMEGKLSYDLKFLKKEIEYLKIQFKSKHQSKQLKETQIQ